MGVLVYTPDEVMQVGLKIAGMSTERQKRLRRKTLLCDFKACYGASPVVLAAIWVDLQITPSEKDRINLRKKAVNLKNFLWSYEFLFQYKTEAQRKVSGGHTRKTLRRWCWYFVERIRALKILKIKMKLQWSTHFTVSVDSVHCRFHETKHDTLSKNPKNYSHKFNGPALAYELALSIYSNEFVWMCGPVKPSTSDLAIYKSGLKSQIPANKKIVCDGGYRDKKDPRLATPNSHDPPDLLTLKAWCRMRQEQFNQHIKGFGCMKQNFCHSMERHRDCFEAICVTCVYEMELVNPMFDV